MTVFTKTFVYEAGAAATDEEIGEISVEKGFKITILEMGFKLDSAGHIDGYLVDAKVDNVDYELMPGINERVVVNRVMAEGEKHRWIGTIGAAGTMAVYVVYDKVKG